MNCQQLVERVTDYLEGRLTDAERELVEVHLAACDGCTACVSVRVVTEEFVVGRTMRRMDRINADLVRTVVPPGYRAPGAEHGGTPLPPTPRHPPPP